MAEISKISGVAIGDVAKVDAVLKANIADINGLTIPADGAPFAAYSVRLLGSAVGVPTYTGDCMRVRRDSDNTEQDIGFDGNGDLDTAAIATFVGSGNNGYIRYWYDQSGNAVDAGQSTAASQPQIYNGTAVITDNGKPALEFNGTSHSLSGPTFSPEISQPMTGSIVANPDIINLMRFWDNMNVGGRLNLSISSASKYEMQNLASSDNAQAIQSLLFCLYNTTSSSLHVNGAEKISGDAGTNSMGSLRIGANKTGIQRFDGKYQEAIFWDANQSSNRTGIETDINTYFSIYT